AFEARTITGAPIPATTVRYLSSGVNRGDSGHLLQIRTAANQNAATARKVGASLIGSGIRGGGAGNQLWRPEAHVQGVKLFQNSIQVLSQRSARDMGRKATAI